MKIVIVMGPPCVGKSSYITENFKDMHLIDLIDYQKELMTIDEIWNSYQECAKDLQDLIKEGKDVVLEHTLLKAKRRKYYLEKIREITDEPVELHCLIANQDVLEKHLKERFQKDNTSSSEKSYLKESIKTLEIPTKSEGFNSIKIITIKE